MASVPVIPDSYNHVLAEFECLDPLLSALRLDSSRLKVSLWWCWVFASSSNDLMWFNICSACRGHLVGLGCVCMLAYGDKHFRKPKDPVTLCVLS